MAHYQFHSPAPDLWHCRLPTVNLAHMQLGDSHPLRGFCHLVFLVKLSMAPMSLHILCNSSGGFRSLQDRAPLHVHSWSPCAPAHMHPSPAFSHHPCSRICPDGNTVPDLNLFKAYLSFIQEAFSVLVNLLVLNSVRLVMGVYHVILHSLLFEICMFPFPHTTLMPKGFAGVT